MLLRQLGYLNALAREGHFARAAEACHVTQPALSALRPQARERAADADCAGRPAVRRVHPGGPLRC
ncbi:MAG: LysR family transcriptional regulator [Mycobacterium sp.]|nr:LysR family transcriptional regulator [Mycobacterium sp.]